MPPVIQITRSTELRELQQRVGKAQEQQQKRNEQLNDFQDIGVQLSVKELTALQAVQEGKNEVTKNMVENPLKQDLLRSQDIAERIQAQVKEIT